VIRRFWGHIVRTALPKSEFLSKCPKKDPGLASAVGRSGADLPSRRPPFAFENRQGKCRDGPDRIRFAPVSCLGWMALAAHIIPVRSGSPYRRLSQDGENTAMALKTMPIAKLQDLKSVSKRKDIP
jgi:hypothetical protein